MTTPQANIFRVVLERDFGEKAGQTFRFYEKEIEFLFVEKIILFF